MRSCQQSIVCRTPAFLPTSLPNLPALPPASRSAAGPWTKLGGFEAGRKENMQRASAWAGQRMKQSVAHSAPAAPALEIFVDPELQVSGAGQVPLAQLGMVLDGELKQGRDGGPRKQQAS